jgi:hypothetical protein
MADFSYISNATIPVWLRKARQFEPPMNLPENARPKPHSRAEPARRSIDGGQVGQIASTARVERVWFHCPPSAPAFALKLAFWSRLR